MAGQTDVADHLDRPLALRTVLAGVRSELLDLGRSADDLQATIGEIAASSPSPLDATAQIRLQAADALSQRLDRLAQLAGALEEEICGECVVKSDPRTVGGIAWVLARLHQAGPPLSRAPEDEGDCEMF